MVFEGSRYSNSELLIDTSTETAFLDADICFIEPQEDDTYYQIIEGDRLDILAKKFYNNPQLNWILLSSNPKYLSELDIKVGDILRVPSLRVVEELFNGN